VISSSKRGTDGLRVMCSSRKQGLSSVMVRTRELIPLLTLLTAQRTDDGVCSLTDSHQRAGGGGVRHADAQQGY
jgi:hypothetical protein